MTTIGKIVIGVAASVAAGLIIKKMDDQHKFDKMERRANVYARKVKKNAKKMMEKGRHEMEYLKDRASKSMACQKEKMAHAKSH